MSKDLSDVIGRVLPAPENFLAPEKLEQARKARRSFMGKALAMGAGVAASAKVAAADGEEAILKMPEHTTGLGLPVVTDGYGKPSFVQHDIAAGGALFDMGVYHISEMLHLLGNPGVLRVSGRTFQKVELDELRAQAGRYSVEELGCGFVNFANGALLEIAEAWAIHLDSFEGSFIVGDKGGIRLRPFSLHQPHGDIDVSGGADLDAFTYRTRKLRSDDNNTDPLQSSQTHWILALQGRTELLNTAELALNTMLISEGIYLSEELGREVTVEEIKERSVARRLPV